MTLICDYNPSHSFYFVERFSDGETLCKLQQAVKIIKTRKQNIKSERVKRKKKNLEKVMLAGFVRSLDANNVMRCERWICSHFSLLIGVGSNEHHHRYSERFSGLSLMLTASLFHRAAYRRCSTERLTGLNHSERLSSIAQRARPALERGWHAVGHPIALD